MYIWTSSERYKFDSALLTKKKKHMSNIPKDEIVFFKTC
jgi:hypothetical protein